MPQEPFRVWLRCVATTVSRSGNRSRRTTRTLWEATDRRIGQVGNGAIEVTLSFALLVGQPPTTLADAFPRVHWELFLLLPRKGLNYRATFHVPVLAENTLLPE
ncbi:hypothetical protein [Thioalkalivibrio paradoxus]|uniref:hypothetical protein n=1 Tax=Thioalkalivibrio paradoxus TaxID=108010 RepID=UPI0012ECB2B6|nr:hypothetical protein [Thioalkalivibrio paradoxus]